MNYKPSLPQYKITTKNNLVYLCDSHISLNKQLALLGNNLKEVYRLNRSVMPSKECLQVRLTKGQKDKIRKRMDTLGLQKISEYIKLLLSVDYEMEILKQGTTHE